jgi:hypothetical protein
MWFFRRRKQEAVEGTGLAEARAERLAAEERLETTQRDLTVPLREMHKENHIGPLISNLIRRSTERSTGDPGPSHS